MSLANIDTLISFAMVMLLLSLLVTTLVETVNTILNSRGRNLLWGVTEVLESLHVDQTRAEQLALEVLTHKTLAPDARGLGRWIEHLARPLFDWITGVGTQGAERRPAAVIRVDEFARLTLDLIQSRAIPAAEAERAAHDALVKRLQGVVDELDRSTSAVGAAPRASQIPQWIDVVVAEARPQLQTLASATGQALLDAESQLNAALAAKLQTAATEARAQAAKVEAWFALVMDRTTERFVAHTRTVTLVVAASLCFAFQIDSLHILDQLSSDPELRGQLVQAATEDFGHLEDVQKSLERGKSLASDTLRALEFKEHAADKQLLAGLEEPLASQDDAERWLDQHVTDAQARQRIQHAFEPAFKAREKERRAELSATRKDLLAQLDATRLDLFALDRGWFDWSWRRIGGVLMSMLLLSLGAPFWFNTLSKLSNLKPIVARKVDAEEKAQSAATAGDVKTTAANK